MREIEKEEASGHQFPLLSSVCLASFPSVAPDYLLSSVMSNPKGVENVKRRTWDVAYYERVAQARQLEEELPQAPEKEFTPAPEGSKLVPGSERAYLQARGGSLGLERRIGEKKVCHVFFLVDCILDTVEQHCLLAAGCVG